MTESLVVHGGDVLTPRGWDRTDVVVEGGHIRRLAKKAPRSGLTIDAEGARVLPGLIDLQVNGALGRSFSTATVAECADVARKLAARGTTGFLAALASLPEKQTLTALGRLAEARALEPSILGAHLEGPFLNPERAGAHLTRNIRPPTLVEFTRLVTAGDGIVRMMTLAPEIKGALSLVPAGVKRGLVMAAGHSMATRAEFESAVRAGLRFVTHLYNAMRPFHHREEGILDGALVDDRVSAALIYDGRHISRSAAEIAMRCKPADKIVCVSDATAAMESPDGEYDQDGTRYTVRGGAVTVRGTTRLGGSSLSLLQCVRRLKEDFDLPLERAWAFASANPAAVLGLERGKGAIAPEYDADLVVLDDHWKVRAAVAAGRVVYGDSNPA